MALRSRRQGGFEVVTPRGSPSDDWLAIVTRPTLAAFAAAFSIEPELSASVLQASIFGVVRIHRFFDATLAMYDRIAFTRDISLNTSSLLEWQGSYRGNPVEGVTILERDAAGTIARVRIFHLPYDQLVAFADELAARLRTSPNPGELPCT